MTDFDKAFLACEDEDGGADYFKVHAELDRMRKARQKRVSPLVVAIIVSVILAIAGLGLLV
jgi:hypothetical protein